MAARRHQYRVKVRWTGNTGSGTSSYRSYSRNHEISAETAGKPPIPGSSDPAFRGDATRWNPEELFVAAVSACHKLWYLHLCATAGIVVTDYVDLAEGSLVEGANEAGAFEHVTLRPAITLTRGADIERARALHQDAHAKCFIANSIRTPVTVEPVFQAQDGPGPVSAP
jgi:organic hydroperoxide reductase OsmC/OhrA